MGSGRVKNAADNPNWTTWVHDTARGSMTVSGSDDGAAVSQADRTKMVRSVRLAGSSQRLSKVDRL